MLSCGGLCAEVNLHRHAGVFLRAEPPGKKMPRIYLCFVWHMHQPFYKDLILGEYKLPWTRLHALKDYYGMVKVLEDFPAVRQTFNLVPSLLVQLEDYSQGAAADPFLRCALKPADQLTAEEQQFILQYFFQANPGRLIYRYPRYGELYDRWLSCGRQFQRARLVFTEQDYRDLQVLSQLAWFDEEHLVGDEAVAELVRKERNYSLQDQALLGRKQIEMIAKVMPIYKEFASRGQIELTTTPFYHPILPLLCDSSIAEVSHPYVPLPSRFRYPQDARFQLESAKRFMEGRFGMTPRGLWPSEGAVSDEALQIAAEVGFTWAATDNGILARTINAPADPLATYRPYVWRQDGKQIQLLFRDHFLSDLIGFVYSRMDAVEAAEHFIQQIHQNCAAILHSGRDALVPIILDGENAWEYYERNGRPFLRELYRRITDDPQLEALTASEALKKIEATPLGHIFPGSWINANFDVWIGAEEDNCAWEYLLRARRTYDRVLGSPEGSSLPEDRKRLAYEELLIAEGSDWCWWYGPEHDSANRSEFDQLFRDHLANVYLALGQTPPDELSQPILKIRRPAFHEAPSGPVRPVLDGEVTSYFEWMGAGLYRVDDRTGAMHGQRFFVNELRYGSDGANLYIRLDMVDHASEELQETEVRVRLAPASGEGAGATFSTRISEQNPNFELAAGRIAELKIPLAAAGLAAGTPVRFQVSLWRRGLPMGALPSDGWIELATAEPAEWLI
jgi:alpha-amylase/alpha-mannosidase (GH57 family)